MKRGSIQEEAITITNKYAPNTGVTKYIKQILPDIKGEINHNTIIVGNFNTPLTSVDRSSKQKINKETLAVSNTSDQVDLVNIYCIFHPQTAEYTLFSSVCGMFSRIDYILSHKKSHNKFKIEIISSIVSNHKGGKLEIKYRKKSGGKTQTWGG